MIGRLYRQLAGALIVLCLAVAGVALGIQSIRHPPATGLPTAPRRPSVTAQGEGNTGVDGAGSAPSAVRTSTVPPQAGLSRGGDLTDPRKKDIAMRLVSSAENSSLDWRAQYAYIQDIHDGRGYTGGIVGFCSGTGDMALVIERYTARLPNNRMARYLPALRKLNGSSAHTGLDPGFPADWKAAAADPLFRQAQDAERDQLYFTPAVAQAKADGLHALGQFAYYDADVVHGPGGLAKIRKAALAAAQIPAQGGSEAAYLNAFLDARVEFMGEDGHNNVSRVETAQRVFLKAGNLGLNPPLQWKVYGDPYAITG